MRKVYITLLTLIVFCLIVFSGYLHNIKIGYVDINTILGIVMGIWYLMFFINISSLYKQYNSKDNDQLDEIDVNNIKDIRCYQLEYLLKGKVSYLSFFATILEMIKKKIIIIREVNYPYNKKNYHEFVLTKNLLDPNIKISDDELLIYQLIFSGVGNGSMCTLTALNEVNNDKNKRYYFYNEYVNWQNKAIINVRSSDFYENKSPEVMNGNFITASLGFILIILNLIYHVSVFFGNFIIVPIIISIIYSYYVNKRTGIGSNLYHNWLSLKNYLLTKYHFNSSNYDTTNKYITYGFILKIDKQIKAKIKNETEQLSSANNNLAYLVKCNFISKLFLIIKKNIYLGMHSEFYPVNPFRPYFPPLPSEMVKNLEQFIITGEEK